MRDPESGDHSFFTPLEKPAACPCEAQLLSGLAAGMNMGFNARVSRPVSPVKRAKLF